MDQTDENLTPAELLETAEKLFAEGDENRSVYRVSILEAITALESNVRDKVFPSLQAKVGDDLTKWLEEKTRMDFETRLGLFIPIATGLKVDKKDKLWGDYKKAKEIRNKVTHSGKKVTRSQARSVIDTVYEWMEYLNQAQESQTQPQENIFTPVELLGKFIQASARLERVIYTATIKSGINKDLSRMRVLPLEELHRLSLVDDAILQELNELRSIRNKAVHGRPNNEEVIITDAQVNRLNEIVDQIEAKQK
jgi:hypothetical protein